MEQTTASREVPDHKRRVVITGIGAITPIGNGADGFWTGVKAGRSATRRIARFDTSSYRSQVAAEIGDFDPEVFLDRKQVKRFDRYSQFAVAVARQAWSDACLNAAPIPRDRIGCCVGSALGGIKMAEEECGSFLNGGLRAIDPMLALSVFVGAAPCNISIDLDITGPATGNGNSCASGTVAIGDALRMIQHSEADAMLAVGAEAPLAPLCFGSFSIIRAMSTRNDDPEHASRPFDRDRDGFVMGEGAAALELEEREIAISHGAHIYGEVLGYALTNDGYHMTAPRPDGAQAARTMSLAIQDANIRPEAIGTIPDRRNCSNTGDDNPPLMIRHFP